MKDRLVFEKTKGACRESGFCCDIERLFGDCEETEQGEDCDENYHFKLVEESEKIQSEYDWKKERYELLCFPRGEMSHSRHQEINNLESWLKENKPERWEVCDKNNTKVGDEVRVLGSSNFRTIEHIFHKQGQIAKYDCVATNISGSYPSELCLYEINVYKEEE